MTIRTTIRRTAATMIGMSIKTTFAALIAATTLAACTVAHAPTARRVGQVSAIAGVVGLISTVALSPYIDGEQQMIGVFSVVSGGGVILFAIGELSEPPSGRPPETETQKFRRWARILTERAAGAAREGRCARVRRLERRVHLYDPEVHDFVFMRDAAIGRCLGLVAPEPAGVELPAAVTSEPDAAE